MPMTAQTLAKSPRRALARPVVLIGLMGAGKTSVGSRLAKMLGVPFRDSDHEIAEVSKMEIAEIFEEFGEEEFRRLERRVIARLLEDEVGILATGGGAFMQEETRKAIAERAVSVWLKADLDVLVSRTAGRTHRPLLNQGNQREILSGLIEARYPLYSLADVHVESFRNQTHEQMARRIIEELEAAGAFENQ
ncbi:shikimate kinase [Rhodobacteraceae bacterium NNCM2]|nr:shikimate kinase [Coraliihabitans acroporae]